MKNAGKKAIYLALLAVLLFSLPGCSHKETEGPGKDMEEQNPGGDKEVTPGGDKEVTPGGDKKVTPGGDKKVTPGGDKEVKPGLAGKIISEDLQHGNQFVMKTEKGYYYYKYVSPIEQGIPAFHYVDAATGRDIYLCNKPECKHDGNSFCVATNKKYDIGQVCLYSGRIFATSVEETDTQFLWKLLTIALDGSEMSEIATYMTMDKAALGEKQFPMLFGGWLPIHRNKAVISLGAAGKTYVDDTVQYGTAILDLDTGKVSYLDEEPLSRENTQATGISAYGDYIYYCKVEGRKTVLHQYCVKDGTDTSFKLQPGFKGTYAVVDEDNIIYIRSVANILYSYHPSTGVTEEAKKMSGSESGGSFNFPISFDVASLISDGTYIYVIQSPVDMVLGEDVTRHRHICVMDRNLEEIALFNLGPVFEDFNDRMLYNPTHKYWSFLGDEIYVMLDEKEDTSLNGRLIYKCNRSDFLEGNPEFTLAYKKE